jgi:hypothetical protein
MRISENVIARWILPQLTSNPEDGSDKLLGNVDSRTDGDVTQKLPTFDVDRTVCYSILRSALLHDRHGRSPRLHGELPTRSSHRHTSAGRHWASLSSDLPCPVSVATRDLPLAAKLAGYEHRACMR